MSLTKSLERGIQSATYNAEAEKAMREEKKQASEARQKYRDALFRIRDKKTDMVAKKEASDYFIINVDKLANEGFAWVTANPDADFQTITDKAQGTAEKFQELSKTNVIVLKISVLPSFLRTVASNALLKKQIKEDKKQALDDFATSLETWLKTTPTLTSDAIVSKEQTIDLELKTILQGTGETVPAVKTPQEAAKAEKAVEKKQVQVKKEEEADKATFQLSRLLKETVGIAGKVVGSLFIVMLILVSGMLTANDAIGRDPMYRIFYFIYGGIGFPVMLVYYLYKWFAGSAPHIYKLLPLYTQESNTMLGRFFLYPFTYAEDAAAKDAKIKFMTEAAELVGKTYRPPAEGAEEKLQSVLEGIQSIALNATSAAKKGTNTILKGLQGLDIVK